MSSEWSTCQVLKEVLNVPVQNTPRTNFMRIQFCIRVSGMSHRLKGRWVEAVMKQVQGRGEKLFITRTKSPVWEMAEQQQLMGAQQRVLLRLAQFPCVSSAIASCQGKETRLERPLLSPSAVLAFVKAMWRKSGFCCWGSCRHPGPRRHLRYVGWAQRCKSVLGGKGVILFSKQVFLLPLQICVPYSGWIQACFRLFPPNLSQVHGAKSMWRWQKWILGSTDHLLNRWLLIFPIYLCTQEDSPPCISHGSKKVCAYPPWYTFHACSFKCPFFHI